MVCHNAVLYHILMRETSGYCVDDTGTVTGGNPCSSGSTPVVASCPASRSHTPLHLSSTQLSTQPGRPDSWHRASSWGRSGCKSGVGSLPEHGSRQGLRVPNRGHISLWLKIHMFCWAFWEVVIKVMFDSCCCSAEMSFSFVKKMCELIEHHIYI